MYIAFHLDTTLFEYGNGTLHPCNHLDEVRDAYANRGARRFGRSAVYWASGSDHPFPPVEESAETGWLVKTTHF